MTTGVKPVSRKAAPAAKMAIAEKNIAGGKKKFHKRQNFACILFYLLLYIGSNGEMAEWSNAVDSKSIVLFTGYPGFESLSLRQFDQKDA